MAPHAEDRYAAGATAWPGLALPRETFATWLAARPEASPSFAADHFLACACLAAVPGAIDAFTARFLAPIARYLGPLGRTPDRVDEVRQRLAIRLFVGDGEGGPKLADYEGAGSLEGWVRISAARTALRLERRERASAAGTTTAVLTDAYDGELVYLRQTYRAHFRRALEVALTTLDPTHRAMLRLHFVEGMTTAAMAALYRVSRATLVRRLTDAKDALRERVASEIGRAVKVSAEEYGELLDAVRSVLDVSIARLLGAPDDDARDPKGA